MTGALNVPHRYEVFDHLADTNVKYKQTSKSVDKAQVIHKAQTQTYIKKKCETKDLEHI